MQAEVENLISFSAGGSSATAQATLETWRSLLPAHSPHASKLDVQTQLDGLSRQWPQRNEAETIFLEKLARKMDVAKVVYCYYELDWKRVALPTPLCGAALGLAIALFLAEAEHWLAGDRGLGLRRLNTAFNGLDLLEKHHFEMNVAPLRSWAEALCLDLR